MRIAGASPAGYANAALILGLLDVLAKQGILTGRDLNTIIVDAISKLEPARTGKSMGGAIEIIKSLFPEVHGSTRPTTQTSAISRVIDIGWDGLIWIDECIKNAPWRRSCARFERSARTRTGLPTVSRNRPTVLVLPPGLKQI